MVPRLRPSVQAGGGVFQLIGHRGDGFKNLPMFSHLAGTNCPASTRPAHYLNGNSDGRGKRQHRFGEVDPPDCFLYLKGSLLG